jgi:ferric-dicitrate binding protein FerR (iron transport regulator)
VTLVGPAVAEVRDDDGVPRIRLVRGRLLGELDGRAGRTLRVETAQLLATIVGTVFAVDAAPSSRVGVLHGML